MQQISTNKLASRKHVEIDGHYYIVKRMGAGDQLTLSQCMRELETLAKKEKTSELSLSDKQKVADIEKLTLEISSRCFDDQEDGGKSLALVKSLSQDELTEIMDEIFNGTKEEPEAKADSEETGTDS